MISNFVDAPTLDPAGAAGRPGQHGKARRQEEPSVPAGSLGRGEPGWATLDPGRVRRWTASQELLQLARSLGLESQVRFRGFRTDVREFLPRYRAYVHAASAESAAFPLAIIEAMAAGLPVRGGGRRGISELCHDGVETRFWSLDDPVEAAATLIGLLDDEPGRLKAAVAASERFRREFDADVVGPRLWSFLRGQGGGRDRGPWRRP